MERFFGANTLLVDATAAPGRQTAHSEVRNLDSYIRYAEM
jgi:hypothetical protein